MQYKGLKIIQDKTGFCFGIDSILLANFASDIKKDSKVVDLGTGTGILGILLCKKTKLKTITGIEIQKEVAQMAQRSIKLNGLENKFNIVNENIKEIINKKILLKNEYDVVVTNPPYKEMGKGVINEAEKKLYSRHEVAANLEDFIEISQNLLKANGKLYMVHKPERLIDIVCTLRKHQLEPKNIKFVCTNTNSKPSLILIKAVKGAKKFLEIEKPLFIYNEDGSYTNQVKEIYNK